eukprot:jgi/Ulvmu1/11656/UM008_0060.1
MYKTIRATSASATRMHAVRTSFRAIGAPPACMSYAARAAVKPKATKEDGDLSQSELIQQVADDLGYDKTDVGAVVTSALQLINETVAKGNKVSLSGFGTFKRTEMKARKGRNPQTGEPLDIAASARPAFTAAKNFKDAVKGEYSGP